MPIDKDNLRATIHEAVAGDAELAALLEQKLLSNDNMAAAFVGGFQRNRDYTQKSQSLAEDRRSLEGQVEQYRQQMEQYRSLLETAETEKAKVLKDLATHKVSVAQAHARLKHIKETYQLSDDDVPTIPDLIDTNQSRKPVDSSVDIDSRLAGFRKDMEKYITEKLVPELGGMAQLDIVWQDIRDEHRELTGKRLSAKEARDLLAEADQRSRSGRPVSLPALWEEKYDVPKLRQKHHDTGLEKELRAKWEAEQQARLSEAAMAGVRPMAPDQQGLRTSNIFEHKFKVHEEEPAAAPKPRETPSATERQALSGAERASKRWLERRGNGVPMGAPDERKSTKVA